MPYTATYLPEAPERAEVDATAGLLLLEFGANWCGHCQAAQPAIAASLAASPQLDRKSTRLNSSHNSESRMPSSA
jgi:thioredoxin 1